LKMKGLKFFKSINSKKEKEKL